MSKNHFDPFDGFREQDSLSKLAGMNDLTRLAGVSALSDLVGTNALSAGLGIGDIPKLNVADILEEILSARSTVDRWVREQNDLAAGSGYLRWMRDADAEMRHRNAFLDGATVGQLASPKLLAFDPSAFVNVTASLSAVSIDVPADLMGVVSAAHLNDVLKIGHRSAASYMSDGLPNHAEAMGLVGTVASATTFAETVSKQIEAMFPTSYAKDLGNLVKSIDFEAIHSVTLGARQRLYGGLADTDALRSLEEIHDVVDDAELGAVRRVVDEAVAAAIHKAAAEGLFAGHKPPSAVLGVLIQIIIAIVGMVGQPIFQHWYEKQNETTSERPPAARPATSPRSSAIVMSTASSLYLRSGPHTTQRIVTVVEHGQLLRVLKTANGWARVSYVDPLGNGVSYTGWIKLKYTQRLEEEAGRLIWCALGAQDAHEDQDEKSCDE
jgi:hypothetical protein